MRYLALIFLLQSCSIFQPASDPFASDNVYWAETENNRLALCVIRDGGDKCFAPSASTWNRYFQCEEKSEI